MSCNTFNLFKSQVEIKYCALEGSLVLYPAFNVFLKKCIYIFSTQFLKDSWFIYSSFISYWSSLVRDYVGNIDRLEQAYLTLNKTPKVCIDINLFHKDLGM